MARIGTALADISNELCNIKACRSSKILDSSNKTSSHDDFKCRLVTEEVASVSGSSLENQKSSQNHNLTHDLAHKPTFQTPSVQKVVLVPTRRRSSRAGLQLVELSESAPAFRQVCLPKTPSTAPTQAIKPPLELLPANTPLAADVLTGLSLGTLADVAVDVAENGTPKPSVLNVFQHNSLSVQANSGDEDQSASHLSQHRSGEAEGISTAAARPRIVPSKAAAKAAKVAVSALAATGPMSRPQASSKDNERKGCNCKRSMCLKMYCECFAAGGFCAPGCACTNCYNHAAEADAVQQARHIVLSKDSKAFEKKVTISEGHKRGCRCKRSKCQKKYCECFHAGAKCNPDICQCEGCENTEDGHTQYSSRAASPESVLSKDALFVASMHPLSSIKLPTGPQTTADTHKIAKLEAKPQSPQQQEFTNSRLAPQHPLVSALPMASTNMAYAGFPLSILQPQLFGSTSAPMFWGNQGTMMPSVFQAMQPLFYNNPAQSLIYHSATLQPQLPALQNLLLPAPPIQSTAYEMSDKGLSSSADGFLTQIEGSRTSNLEHCSSQQQDLNNSAAEGHAAEVSGTKNQVVPSQHRNAGMPTTIQKQQGPVALTAHLSECQGHIETDDYDTATSPAPQVVAKTKKSAVMMNKRALHDTGAGNLCSRQPLQPQLESSSPASSTGSDLLHQSKRPKRVASGGVSGAVAAEAAVWGEEPFSPPKRAIPVPVAGQGNRSKTATRFALLRRALEAETAHARKQSHGVAQAADKKEQRDLAADEREVISALFELSSSVSFSS